jgi:NADPH:quinone reductase-like Zn-dependent oxidoreductase
LERGQLVALLDPASSGLKLRAKQIILSKIIFLLSSILKAIFFEQHGELEVLKYADIPEPRPLSGQALIKVKACALNHLDIWVRKGWEGLQLGFPHVGGADVAGEVVAVSDPNKQFSFAPGSKVIINPGIISADDEFTRRGEDSLSPGYKILGEQIKGGMAEYVVVPTENVYKLPDGWSFEEGASPLLVGTTCWRMLFNRGNLRAGETVLIVGAGGGVNSLAISFAKAAGATVLVLAGDNNKLKLAEQLGAEFVVNYKEKTNWHLDVLKYTKGRGVDLIVDNVGAKTFPMSIRALRRGGRLVTVGNTSGHDLKLDNRLIFTKQISIIGSTMGSRQDFQDAISFMIKHKIRAVIDRVEPLKKGIDMLAYLESGKQFGKVVLST